MMSTLILMVLVGIVASAALLAAVIKDDLQ